MATRFDPSISLPSAHARGIALAGAVLIVLFLSILSASLLPARLLDAAWQLRVGGVLINASPFPLIGLVLLHVAASLDPEDPLLAQRRSFAARLAVAVALGNLLLAPLLAAANLQRQHSQALASSGELRRATEQLKQMRQVLNTATSIPELEQRLTALEGPRLDEADRSLPLPLLRSRIAALLDQAATRLERARSAAPPTSPWILLGEIARTSVACLALAVGYAGLAWRPGSELSLLKELQMRWEHLRYRRGALRGRSGRTSADADYLHQISGAEDGEDGSQR
ncbi:MAG: HpsJ family protein [Cyanobacteriota bacterium]